MMEKEMPFLDHLEELRKRILVVLLFFACATAAAFFFSGMVLPLFIKPLLGKGLSLIAVEPSEKFLAYLKIAMVAGIIAGFPLALAEFAFFISPALLEREKKLLVPAVLSSFVLGCLGAAFSFFILIPFAFGFFASFGSGDGIENLWSFGSCVDLALELSAASVIAFQFPWLLVCAIKTGILDVLTLVKYRRHVVVIIFIVAAVITPPDVFSQSIVALVLWVLFELTVLFGRMAGKKNSR